MQENDLSGYDEAGEEARYVQKWYHLHGLFLLHVVALVSSSFSWPNVLASGDINISIFTSAQGDNIIWRINIDSGPQ